MIHLEAEVLLWVLVPVVWSALDQHLEVRPWAVGPFGVALAHLQTEAVVWLAEAVLACHSISIPWAAQAAPWLWPAAKLVVV